MCLILAMVASWDLSSTAPPPRTQGYPPGPPDLRYTTVRRDPSRPPGGRPYGECAESHSGRAGAGRAGPGRHGRPRARADHHAHDVLVGVAPAPPDRCRAAGLGQRGGEGHQRPRQVHDAAEAPLGAARHLRCRAGRSRGPLLRHRELHKGGVADGVFFPLESITSFKLETVLEQATLFPGGMYSSAFGFFMNEDKWNKLPKQDQDAITKLSGEHIARLAGRSWDEADVKGLDALKKSGVKIVNADAAFVAEVSKRSAPIVEDWIKKASAKGTDAAKILAEFRAELKKVAAEK